MSEVEDESGVESADRILGQGELASLAHHDLTGKGEPDARASLLGGEEGNEDFASHVGRDGTSIVADEQGIVPAQVHALRSCFHGILHEVDEHLSQQVLVAMHHEGVG